MERAIVKAILVRIPPRKGNAIMKKRNVRTNNSKPLILFPISICPSPGMKKEETA